MIIIDNKDDDDKWKVTKFVSFFIIIISGRLLRGYVTCMFVYMYLCVWNHWENKREREKETEERQEKKKKW